MTHLELYQRDSNTYADGWAHLDEWQHLGTVKLLAMRQTREPEGHDDGGRYLARVIAPRALKGRDLGRAIESSLGGSSCRHEHDCCGCPTTYARAKRITSREYSVSLSVSYNY
jgi:hypothetical protein